MRKSNSKEARRAVEAYVLKAIEPVNERARFDGTFDPAIPVTSAFNVLMHELDYQSACDRHVTGLEIMGAGLARDHERAGRHDHITADNPYRVWQLFALIGSVEVWTADQRAALANWMDETPEEASRYSADQVEAQFCHMTAQAFERLYNREQRARK